MFRSPLNAHPGGYIVRSFVHLSATAALAFGVALANAQGTAQEATQARRLSCTTKSTLRLAEGDLHAQHDFHLDVAMRNGKIADVMALGTTSRSEIVEELQSCRFLAARHICDAPELMGDGSFMLNHVLAKTAQEAHVATVRLSADLRTVSVVRVRSDKVTASKSSLYLESGTCSLK